MTATLVSVIVPVYNDEKYLHECIDSILNQSHKHLEIILVDDGSTDSSGLICDKYAISHPCVKVIHKLNEGVSAARNTGVANSSGEYIMMVDADDVVHHNIIEKLLQAIDVSNGCKAALCRFTVKGKEYMTTQGKILTLSPCQVIERTLYQDAFDSSLWAKLFPADAVKKAPQPHGCRYEDLDTIYRIYENIKGNIACMSATMYYYRINRENFISSFTTARLDVLEVTDRIENHYSTHPTLIKAANDRKFSANYNMFVLATRAGVKDAAQRCWEVIKDYRWRAILNPHVRLKNKIGAILSYGGKKVVMSVSRFIYK